LASATDRTLVVAELVGGHAGSGWFAPAEIGQMFEMLRVEPPRNISDVLAHLRAQRFVTRRTAKPPWSLTPGGREHVSKLIGDIDPDAFAVELAEIPGAKLGHAVQKLLPPALAPTKWAGGIQQMLEEFEFDRNVFCMTRFPEDPRDTEYLDPIREIVPAARAALARHGLVLHLASDRQLDQDLYGNIAAHMWACRFGLALFEDRLGRGLNHNMTIEVGSMLMTGRVCALLKDSTVERMPTDFVGQIYRPADFSDAAAVTAEIHRWAVSDLRLERCSECPDPL
jgi:hypothetical protein